MSERPLEGITVIDCGTLIAGPLSAMYLADFGAEVIKVEHPEYGDSVRSWGKFEEPVTWKWIGRNKKSVTLDLHDDRGQALFRDLAEDADILIESFRPGTLEGWNIGWETLSEINPELIMVRTTGFGQTGPYSDRPGFGTLAEGMSGWAYINGEADGPPILPPMALADSLSALHSTFAAMMALFWRELRDGTGQYIDSNLLEPILGVMGRQAVTYSVTGYVRERNGSRSYHSAPRNIYETKDGKYIAMAAATEGLARNALRLTGGEDVANDPRFQTAQGRIEHVDEIDRIVEDWTKRYDRDEVLELLEEHDIPSAPINSVKEIMEDPHLADRDFYVEFDDSELGEMTMPDAVPRMSETPGRVDHPGPELGAHTLDVLTEKTSITVEELRELDRDGVTRVEEWRE